MSRKCDRGKIARVEHAGVENAGVDSRGGKCRSKSYGTPTRDYIEKTSSYFVGLVLILLTYPVTAHEHGSQDGGVVDYVTDAISGPRDYCELHKLL